MPGGLATAGGDASGARVSVGPYLVPTLNYTFAYLFGLAYLFRNAGNLPRKGTPLSVRLISYLPELCLNAFTSRSKCRSSTRRSSSRHRR